ncbi:hypothetical protein ElyMa_001159200 [Elysia marginata]|uniref:Uncharacterized protein n=1 Tax=Elysia marginata TaxID=1093978 RepID=A0AAV4I1A8_9GAST|nr:hypothetical protein ElyMa_001159200 [Elysia marginata]
MVEISHVQQTSTSSISSPIIGLAEAAAVAVVVAASVQTGQPFGAKIKLNEETVKGAKIKLHGETEKKREGMGDGGTKSCGLTDWTVSAPGTDRIGGGTVPPPVQSSIVPPLESSPGIV